MKKENSDYGKVLIESVQLYVMFVTISVISY